MRVSGRMLREPTVTEHVHGDLAVIRVDDSRDPEIWFEITIRQSELLALLAQMRDFRDAARVARGNSNDTLQTQ